MLWIHVGWFQQPSKSPESSADLNPHTVSMADELAIRMSTSWFRWVMAFVTGRSVCDWDRCVQNCGGHLDQERLASVC